MVALSSLVDAAAVEVSVGKAKEEFSNCYQSCSPHRAQASRSYMIGLGVSMHIDCICMTGI